MSANLKVSRLTRLSEIDALADEWHQLEGRARDATPFSTWEWCGAVAKFHVAGRPLWVFTLRDGGELVGIAPFAETRFGGLRLLRMLGSALLPYSMADYQEFLLAEDREDDAIAALCDDLSRRARMGRSSPPGAVRRFAVDAQVDGSG